MSELRAQLDRLGDLIAAERWNEALVAVGPLRRANPYDGRVWRIQALALRGAGYLVEASAAAQKWADLSGASSESLAFKADVAAELACQRAREAERQRARYEAEHPGLGASRAVAQFPGLPALQGSRVPIAVPTGAPTGYPFYGGDPQGGTPYDEHAPLAPRHWPRAVAMLAALAVLAAFVFIPRLRTSVVTVAAPTSVPVAVREPVRDITQPPANGHWKFLNLKDGEPVRHDPCTPIHYMVRTGAGAPADAIDMVKSAVEQVSEVTGLTFIYDGTTDRVPTRSSGEHVSTDAPAVIAWASLSETDLFDATDGVELGEMVGVGGPVLVTSSSGDERYVGGFVIVRSDVHLTDGFGPGASQGNVLLHELGHLVGLAHVEDPNELMAPATSDYTLAGYGPGDLYGLWQLGSSKGCL